MLQIVISASPTPYRVEERILFKNRAVVDKVDTMYLQPSWGAIPGAVACLDSRVSYCTNMMLNLG
ncbi:hypothetical protein SAMN05216421_2545 [Halopseudomonas xinjiangensis]|uniref:Uncharacterized protein n=1 Tax=Halopseudomonas xinjiangensis TaxID=487184 RepID=A0A1H1WBQ2_9GAMM|nr:hypothetical protein SAMN05216421_2545 [Halopseudomonas xinjiangensis]